MVVVYYVNTYYLDAAIEILQSIKNKVELHVLIELAPESSISNIIEINSLINFDSIATPLSVLGIRKWDELKPYFEGVASVHFIVFKHKKTFSFSSLFTAIHSGIFIKGIKPDVIHFDSISPRLLGTVPLLINKKIFITVHDPLPHSGEGSWKLKLAESIYFKMAAGLFFYSHFAKIQFERTYNRINVKKYVIHFQPFSFLKRYKTPITFSLNHILFFGRILLYKGVDLLFKAIPMVLSKHPDEKFIIAGKQDDVNLDLSVLKDYSSNVSLMPSYISTELLAELIHSSKFIICPYRDATQSGVLMTAHALKKPVVATNVGAFPEYIQNNINGILCLPTVDDIADAIIDMLNNNKYVELSNNVQSVRSKDIDQFNFNSLMNAYYN